MSTQIDEAFLALKTAIDAVDDAGLEAAIQTICAHRSGAIMGYGCGREGLQIQGFMMRLAHLGLNVSMQGDMAAPPLGKGDLLLVSAGPGELSTVRALMGQAKKAGASCILLTSQTDAPLADLSTQKLVLPATTMADDQAAEPVLPMGSLYEGAMFVLFELIVLKLKPLLGETSATMRARHTNME